jgi:hypothetical protein
MHDSMRVTSGCGWQLFLICGSSLNFPTWTKVPNRHAKNYGIIFEETDPIGGQKVPLQNNDDINFLRALKKLTLSIRA